MNQHDEYLLIRQKICIGLIIQNDNLDCKYIRHNSDKLFVRLNYQLTGMTKIDLFEKEADFVFVKLQPKS